LPLTESKISSLVTSGEMATAGNFIPKTEPLLRESTKSSNPEVLISERDNAVQEEVL